MLLLDVLKDFGVLKDVELRGQLGILIEVFWELNLGHGLSIDILSKLLELLKLLLDVEAALGII